MQKALFPRSLGWQIPLLCLTGLILPLNAAFAQDSAANSQSTQSAPAMPSDPKELMALASRSNNLTDEDTKPWHLRATFKVLDDQGNATDEGTYEEFWASPTKSKVTYTGSAFSRTDYRTDHGLLRSGGDPTSSLIISAGLEFTEPLPNREAIGYETLELQQRDTGSMKLSCLNITGLPSNPRLNYCLDDRTAALRISVIGFQSLQVLHNRIQKFQDHFVAGDLQFIRDAKTVLTAHLEKIEPLDPLMQAEFTPSADARLVARKITISAGVAGAFLSQKAPVEYPLDARAAGISGTVALQIVIGKDGHVTDIHVINGPSALQQAAVDSVRKWVYRPYLLNGEAVTVNTVAYVVFKLGR